MKRELRIVRISTGDVVYSADVTGKPRDLIEEMAGHLRPSVKPDEYDVREVVEGDSGTLG